MKIFLPEKVEAPTDLFRCVPYEATIMARACVQRQRAMQRPMGQGDGLRSGPAPAFDKCVGCTIGESITRRVGSKVEPDRSPGRPRNHRLDMIGHKRGKVLPAVMSNPPAPITSAGSLLDPAPLEQEPEIEPAPVTVDSARAPLPEPVSEPEPAPIAHRDVKPDNNIELEPKLNPVAWIVEPPPEGTPEPPKPLPPELQTVVDLLMKIPFRPEPEETPPEAVRPDLSVIEHVFPLRKNFNVHVNLPVDFNEKDVRRMVRWLETVPFDDE